MLKIQKLSKKFGNKAAVCELSLEASVGEIYGFIGPNGAGKTTTIKMVAGVFRPTSGTAVIDGFDILNQPIKAKKRLGYIPDEPFVYNQLTGREFLYFSGSLYGLSFEQRKKRIDKLLKVFPIDDLIDGYFGDFSRGTKQKLMIIAAFLHQPKVVLIDEPVVGLDPQSARAAAELFKDFAKNGGTIFVSTHTLSVAEQICDRIGIISQGKLVGEGTIGELRSKAHQEGATLEEVYLERIGEEKL